MKEVLGISYQIKRLCNFCNKVYDLDTLKFCKFSYGSSHLVPRFDKTEKCLRITIRP